MAIMAFGFRLALEGVEPISSYFIPVRFIMVHHEFPYLTMLNPFYLFFGNHELGLNHAKPPIFRHIMNMIRGGSAGGSRWHLGYGVSEEGCGHFGLLCFSQMTQMTLKWLFKWLG